ncbi:MAG: hypothetical protein IKS29_08510 [Oscillospiraceae bacterium]|nr:hypothetical protein [Oscillospiraceae bacterium]
MEIKKLTSALCLMLAFFLLLCGCMQVYDGPPKDDGTPEPPAHTGTFVSEAGTLTFPGDGKTVQLDLGQELAALTGLPAGKSEGSYIFFANLPPHHVDYRYDKADELQITVGDTVCRFRNWISRTNENTIYLTYPGTDGKESMDLVFEKQP